MIGKPVDKLPRLTATSEAVPPLREQFESGATEPTITPSKFRNSKVLS